MTALSNRKTRLTFATDVLVSGREVVVEPEPLVVVLRLKGKRHRVAISWQSVYVYAAQIAADKLRAERKAARKLRRVAA